MAYSSKALANAFIKRAIAKTLPELTPMKLQKLMFYAQSWHLKLYDSPLTDDFFVKWKYGPVIPSVYHELKSYGSKEITSMIKIVIEIDSDNRIFTPIISDDDTRSNALIDRICTVYGELKGAQLSYLTHEQNTAWSATEKEGDVISNNLLKEKIEAI